MKIIQESWNLAHISTLVCTWKFHLNFFHSSCHQLSIAVNSWEQLIKMKISLKSWNLAHISTLVCIWKFQLNFSPYQLSSAVNSCQQLKTIDENENQPRELKFGTDITWRLCIQHPAQHFLYQLSSAINRCQQLKITPT